MYPCSRTLYDPGCAPRIQCPAIVALVVTLLGAVLSFTCVPVTTKEASVQSAHQGKPHLPTTGPMCTTLPQKPAPWASTGNRKTFQSRGLGGT